ncbi:unnamed protein product [Prorocentrum cordatum]|uniref:Uncharacterized protein n=1 Tax=Prorocentrum cordatum TaxID=2364126 RepID=A0ABN9WJ83_9DINO|nr:unnamed protein product [Polarella glacialis]
MEDPDPAAKKRKLEEAAAPAAAEPEAAVVAEQGAGDAAALEAATAGTLGNAATHVILPVRPPLRGNFL